MFSHMTNHTYDLFRFSTLYTHKHTNTFANITNYSRIKKKLNNYFNVSKNFLGDIV